MRSFEGESDVTIEIGDLEVEVTVKYIVEGEDQPATREHPAEYASCDMDGCLCTAQIGEYAFELPNELVFYEKDEPKIFGLSRNDWERFQEHAMIEADDRMREESEGYDGD